MSTWQEVAHILGERMQHQANANGDSCLQGHVEPPDYCAFCEDRSAWLAYVRKCQQEGVTPHTVAEPEGALIPLAEVSAEPVAKADTGRSRPYKIRGNTDAGFGMWFITACATPESAEAKALTWLTSKPSIGWHNAVEITRWEADEMIYYRRWNRDGNGNVSALVDRWKG